MYSQRVIDSARASLEANLKFPLVEYSQEEVEDWNARLATLVWDEDQQPSRRLDPEEEKFIMSNLLLSRISFPYFLSRFCLVMSDEKKLVPLVPWPGQLKILELLGELEEAMLEVDDTGRRRVKIRLILLKARQVGGTAFAEALVAHMLFLNHNTQGIIASDHPDNSNKLWHTLLAIHSHLPEWMKPPFDAKVKATNLHLPTINSDVVVGAGNQKTTLGQGITVDVAHLTEFSTWIPEMWLALKADLFPAFDSSWKHHSFMFIESTASGVEGNMFHDIYRSAQAGTSLFKPLFLPWYSRPGWTTNSDGVEFDEKTLAMTARVKREEGLELRKGQMAWWQSRRKEAEAEGNLEIFLQEMPSSVEEAFQSPFKSVYPIEVRTKVRDSVRVPLANLVWNEERGAFLDEGEQGEDRVLTVWEKPRKGFHYVVGVDGSYGMSQDGSAVSVLRVGTVKEPDEQVAEYWTNTTSPDKLAPVLNKVGRMYGDQLNDGWPAKMAIEANTGSPGLQTQTELLKLGYPNFYIWRRPWRVGGGFSKEMGWWTTGKTRPWLTSKGVEGIKTGDLLPNSLRFCDEMKSFISMPNRFGIQDYQHAPMAHDDCQFALFIAYYVAHELDERSIAEDRRLQEKKRVEVLSAKKPIRKPTWQNTLEWNGRQVTSESMWDLADEVTE